MERIKVKDLPHKDRPYEECLHLGPDSLSDTEFLAVILHTESREGNSLNLVGSLLALENPGDSLLGLLHHFLDDFMGIEGMGKIKGVQLLCIGELSKRIWKRETSEHALYLGRPEEMSDYYMENMRHLKQEEIHVMFLNTGQAIIRDQIMTRGTINAPAMTPREVLIGGFRRRAVSMVLVHSHPSRDPIPNRADMLLAERLKEAGELVGITLIDHVVTGDRCYLSFHEENLI